MKSILRSVVAVLIFASSLAALPVIGLPYYPLRVTALQNQYGIQMVEIDIKPGKDPNRIEIESEDDGKIPVAILSTFNFDASKQVDRNSLTFGRTGDEDTLHRRGRKSIPNCNVRDVNHDGLRDLVCRFLARKTGFQPGDTEGILKGQTGDGVRIEGHDSVQIGGEDD